MFSKCVYFEIYLSGKNCVARFAWWSISYNTIWLNKNVIFAVAVACYVIKLSLFGVQ